MKVFDFPQYSLEWWQARRGLPTASRASEILTATGKPSASRFPYMAELVADSMGFGEEEEIQTQHMARGLELEEDARLWLELQEHEKVHEVGLIMNDDETALCSPDGLFGYHDGERLVPSMGIEIKVPMAKTHVVYALRDELPPAYKQQVHFSMAVSGIRTWLFCSYHPEIEPFTKVIHWDEYTDKMAEALALFIEQLADAKEQFK